MDQSTQFLRACLLQAVQDSAGYGWAISAQLEERYKLVVEKSRMYRNLRGLEGKGYLTSAWGDPVAGPKRRIYKLTRKGKWELEYLSAIMERERNRLNVFLQGRMKEVA